MKESFYESFFTPIHFSNDISQRTAPQLETLDRIPHRQYRSTRLNRGNRHPVRQPHDTHKHGEPIYVSLIKLGLWSYDYVASN